MKTFKQYLQERLILEAIPLHKAKDIMKSVGDSYKTLLNDIFQGKNRIILPQTISYKDVEVEVENTQLSLYNRILSVFYKNGYEMDAFSDYVHNKCYQSTDTKRKRPIRIGKVLTKLGETDLLKSFEVDPTRIKDDYKILISKHPYDIAGISTDRNWTSCMDLGTDRIHYKSKSSSEGVHSDSVELYIKNHALVAYLVSDDDKNKYGKYTLKRPIARILIYPFKGITDDGEEKYAYHPSSTIYGVRIDKFYDKVKEWVYKEINTDIDDNLVYSKIEGAYYDSIYDEPDFRTELSPQEIARQYNFKYIQYTDNTLEEFAEQSLWDVFINIPFDMQNLTIDTPEGPIDIRKDGFLDDVVENELLSRTSLNTLFSYGGSDTFNSVTEIGKMFEIILQRIQFSKMAEAFPNIFEDEDYNIIRAAFKILSIIDDEISNNIDLEQTVISWLEYAQDLVNDYIKGLDSEDQLDYDEIRDIIRNSYYEI